MADFGKLNFAVAFNPQTAFPLDARSYFDSLEAAKAAAAGAAEVGSSTSTYYFGQTIVVVDGGVATSYIIQPDHSLVPLAQDSGEAVKVPVNESFFKYDETGKLTFNTSIDKVSGAYLGINGDGQLDWIIPVDAYSKTETDNRIAAEIAKVDHLSRKIVDELADIDIEDKDALKYIYMVPTGLQEDDDKYNEYMVIESAEGARSLEKVGDWAVDLGDYATKDELKAVSDAVDKKVDFESGKRLMNEAEGVKLNTIEEGAQKNYVKSVTTELSVDDEGKLGINVIAQDKVSGLTEELQKKVEAKEGWSLLSPDDQVKLSKLTVGDGDGLEISGSVNASNVKELDTWLENHAASQKGLSENNFSDDLKTKLEAAAGITSVSEEFTLDDDVLTIATIDRTKITGLDDAFVSQTAYNVHVNEFTTYQGTINKAFETVNSRIDALEDALTWKNISE